MFLFQMDNFTFLCDCGWDPRFDMTVMDEIKKVVHKVS